MKKKILTGFLLGTLAFSTTPFMIGCSDEDEINRLEEQMIKDQQTAAINKSELTALINSVKEELEADLDLAVSGKADNQAVVELQAKLDELSALLNSNNEANAAQVADLLAQIAALAEQVNAVKGDLDAQKADLEKQIEAAKADLQTAIEKGNSDIEKLNASLAELQSRLNATDANLSAQHTELESKIDGVKGEIAAVNEKIEKQANTLTTLQNDLLKVKELSDDNAAAIVEIKTKLAAIDDLAARVAKLEESSATYAADIAVIKGQLATFASKSDVEAIKDQITKLAAATDLNALADRVAALETYKNETLQSLLNDKANASELADALDRIAAIEKQIKEFSYVDAAAYNEKMQAIDADINALKETHAAIFGMINAQIQSIMFVPEFNDRGVYFDYLLMDTIAAQEEAKYVQIAGPKDGMEVRFLVSPAAAAASFEDNYDVSIYKRVATQRSNDDDVFSIEYIDADEKTGLVTFNVNVRRPGTELGTSYWSTSLCVSSKTEKADTVKTDISSDFFTLAVKKTQLTSLYPNTGVTTDKLNFYKGESLTYDLKLTTGNTVGQGEDYLAKYDLKKEVSYELVNEDGVANGNAYVTHNGNTLSAKNDAAAQGSIVTVKALLSLKDVNDNEVYKSEMTYNPVTLTGIADYTANMGTKEFNLADGLTVTWSAEEIAQVAGIDVATFKANFTAAAKTGVVAYDYGTTRKDTLTLTAQALKVVPESDEALSIEFAGKDKFVGAKVIVKVALEQSIDTNFGIKTQPRETMILADVTGKNYEEDSKKSTRNYITKALFKELNLDEYFYNISGSVEYSNLDSIKKYWGEDIKFVVEPATLPAGVSCNNNVINVDPAEYVGGEIKAYVRVENTINPEVLYRDSVSFTAQTLPTKWEGKAAITGKISTLDGKFNLYDGLKLVTRIDGTDYLWWEKGIWRVQDHAAIKNANNKRIYFEDLKATLGSEEVPASTYVTINSSNNREITINELSTAPNDDVIITTQIIISEGWWGTIPGMPAERKIPVTVTIEKEAWLTK